MTTFLIGVAIAGKVITGFNVFNQSQITLLKWDYCLRELKPILCGITVKFLNKQLEALLKLL